MENNQYKTAFIPDMLKTYKKKNDKKSNKFNFELNHYRANKFNLNEKKNYLQQKK